MRRGRSTGLWVLHRCCGRDVGSLSGNSRAATLISQAGQVLAVKLVASNKASNKASSWHSLVLRHSSLRGAGASSKAGSTASNKASSWHSLVLRHTPLSQGGERGAIK